jgi:hypothetical protein
LIAECQKLPASEAPDPGRYHVGTPGDIISECPGDFVGIRTLLTYVVGVMAERLSFASRVIGILQR